MFLKEYQIDHRSNKIILAHEMLILFQLMIMTRYFGHKTFYCIKKTLGKLCCMIMMVMSVRLGCKVSPWRYTGQWGGMHTDARS